MIDVDGTLVPNKRDGMPSEKVKNAIEKASKKIHVGIATSRPEFIVNHIFADLNLSGPSIISGGARVIDVKTGKIYYDMPMVKKDVEQIIPIVKKYNQRLILDSSKGDVVIKSIKDIPINPLGGYISGLTEKTANKIKKEIEYLDVAVTLHIVNGWQGKRVITFSHMAATKQHGIWEVAKVLGIETNEIIGIGDGANDFPLLMACGLKIAMENAIPDLKAIADYIAPSVDEDGVAHVIEKFVL